MGDATRAGAQYAANQNGGQPVRAHAGVRVVGTYRHRTNDAALPTESRHHRSGSDIAPGCDSEVFDLINCGPRRRFVVQSIDGQPLIVHNCENVTQATANDILRTSLRVLPETVLHVHDEIVLEVPESAADAAAARLREVMCTPPAWAGELPLNCEVKIMERYGK